MANLLTLVEGVCVGFLSSPNVRLRSYTFDILRAVRYVAVVGRVGMSRHATQSGGEGELPERAVVGAANSTDGYL